MLRRHFFLVAALVALVLMGVAGGLKMAFGKKPPGQGSVAAGKGPPGNGPGRGPGRGPGGGAISQVSATTVEQRAFVDSIDVLGVAKGRQSVTLTAAATQLVDRVRFTDGQFVQKGAVLVELRAIEQDALLEQTEARLVQAKRAYERYKSLNDSGFASKAQLDQFEAAYFAAQADVSAARARQNDRVIRAPFAGVVGLSDVAPGALVNPGAPIVTLDDLSAIRVDFQVPERFLSQVREGQAITASVDAFPGETIQGRIAKLDSRVDERTRAITARAEFPNPGGRLKSGMMIRVAVARGERRALSAPETAVSVQGDSAFVYLISNKDGRASVEQRPVVTGARIGGLVEILDGVQAGDRIIATGLNRVQPGQPVQVVAGVGAPQNTRRAAS